MSCQINKRIQETRAKCDDYRKDLTHCDHTSTICVHVYHRVCVCVGGGGGAGGGGEEWMSCSSRVCLDDKRAYLMVQ